MHERELASPYGGDEQATRRQRQQEHGQLAQVPLALCGEDIGGAESGERRVELAFPGAGRHDSLLLKRRPATNEPTKARFRRSVDAADLSCNVSGGIAYSQTRATVV
jgi:hypothetical protein